MQQQQDESTRALLKHINYEYQTIRQNNEHGLDETGLDDVYALYRYKDVIISVVSGGAYVIQSNQHTQY